MKNHEGKIQNLLKENQADVASFERSILITALWLQFGRIHFVPNSSSKALSLVGTPRTVHDEDEHRSIAAHLLSFVHPIGVSPSQE
jgi:hypothetical protein